jgi:hypothetical protein
MILNKGDFILGTWVIIKGPVSWLGVIVKRKNENNWTVETRIRIDIDDKFLGSKDPKVFHAFKVEGTEEEVKKRVGDFAKSLMDGSFNPQFTLLKNGKLDYVEVKSTNLDVMTEGLVKLGMRAFRGRIENA